ncbi:hypothetical protein ACPA9J_26760 [Pseudomonas aeruginosa]
MKVSVRTLVKLSRQEQSAIIRTLNEFGFLLLRSEQGEDRQELPRSRSCSAARPHPRADADGIVPISNARYVAATSAPRRWSTSCTPTALSRHPGAISSLQCVRNAREGGRPCWPAPDWPSSACAGACRPSISACCAATP